MKYYLRAQLIGDFVIEADTEDDLNDLMDGYSQGDVLDAVVNADKFNVVMVEVVDAD